jgi:hypothetical protein
MKIYVASSYRNIAETREVIAALRSDGHEITHDWTERGLEKAGLVEGTTEADTFLEECGREDFIGVQACEALVLLAHPECRDALVEFGMALGMGKFVVVVNPERRRSVFYGAGATVRADLAAARLILKRLDGRG